MKDVTEDVAEDGKRMGRMWRTRMWLRNQFVVHLI